MYVPDSPDSISDDPPYEIAPSVWSGSYACLSDHFLHTRNIKVIVNCSQTFEFFTELESSGLAISSDMVVLSLDPSFSLDAFEPSVQTHLSKQIVRFNRVLQNYLQHFYVANPKQVIHQSYNNQPLAISSPVLTGGLLQNSLFQINRLIKLIKNVNTSVEVLVVSRDGCNSLTTATCVSYLMDSYNLDLRASFKQLQLRNPKVPPFNVNYYEDLIIVESLRKFYTENATIKQASQGVLTSHSALKRHNDEEMVGEVEGKRRH
ncbi:Uncharacterized protein ABC855_g4059 [[Candida] zeylanoides]